MDNEIDYTQTVLQLYSQLYNKYKKIDHNFKKEFKDFLNSLVNVIDISNDINDPYCKSVNIAFEKEREKIISIVISTLEEKSNGYSPDINNLIKLLKEFEKK